MYIYADINNTFNYEYKIAIKTGHVGTGSPEDSQRETQVLSYFHSIF